MQKIKIKEFFLHKAVSGLIFFSKLKDKTGFFDKVSVPKKFLESKCYHKAMFRFFLKNEYGHDEAERKTPNFRYRHFYLKNKLGVFRWRGIQENLNIIFSIIDKPNVKVVDLGGAASPLGLGSIVVDHLSATVLGDKVIYRNLRDLAGLVDVIFTSHCLEHVKDLHGILFQIKNKLKIGGYLIAHVPAYTCHRWQPKFHKHSQYNDHFWSFYIDDKKLNKLFDKQYDSKICAIDKIIGKYFHLVTASYCGDNSIFIIAKK